MGFKNEHRQTLTNALKLFPDHPELLQRAFTDAMDRRAFQKAARIAADILKKDPTNSKVRDRILAAHVAHAGKQIGQGRADLAERELAKAEAFQKRDGGDGLLETCRGLLALYQDKRDEGERWLETGRARAGDPVPAALMAAVGAWRMSCGNRIRLAMLERLRQAASQTIPTPAALSVSLKILREAHQQRDLPIDTFMDQMAAYSKAAADLTLSPEERIDACLLCHAFHRHDELKRFALQGERQRPDDPVFLFFRLFALSQGRPWAVRSRKDLRRLSELFEARRDRLPLPLASLIEDFLDESPESGHPTTGSGRHPPFGSGSQINENDPEEMDIILNLIEVLVFTHLPQMERMQPAAFRNMLIDRYSDKFPFGPAMFRKLIDMALERLDA
ncbi:MAG: hypothetical protein HQL82_15845 [Magnetococcales bacterium]|nr:hypothetical protein [Magnetococcales bacterium]